MKLIFHSSTIFVLTTALSCNTSVNRRTSQSVSSQDQNAAEVNPTPPPSQIPSLNPSPSVASSPILNDPILAGLRLHWVYNNSINHPSHPSGKYCVPNNIGNITGSYLGGVYNPEFNTVGSPPQYTDIPAMQQFVSFKEEQIKAQLEYLLQTRPFAHNEQSYLIVDLEHPIMPRQFDDYIHWACNGNYLNNKCKSPGRKAVPSFKDIVNAYKMRFKVLKKKFPNAKIGVYFVQPHPGFINLSQSFLDDMMGYESAVKLKFFAELDFIVPVLYLRMNPDHDGKKDQRDWWNYVGQYTRNVLEQTAALVPNHELLPLLAPRAWGAPASSYTPFPESVALLTADPHLQGSWDIQYREIAQFAADHLDRIKRIAVWSESPQIIDHDTAASSRSIENYIDEFNYPKQFVACDD